jgi:hypothetical protein
LTAAAVGAKLDEERTVAMRRWAIAATCAWGLVASAVAFAADPFLGVWRSNPAKSKLGGRATVTETITVKAAPKGHKWSYDIELSDGRRVHFWLVTDIAAGTVTLYMPDGQVMGTGSVRKTGPTSWELETPKHKSRGSLSADGKTMTVVQTLPEPSTIVLDKIK